jgi:hypothetical protein
MATKDLKLLSDLQIKFAWDWVTSTHMSNELRKCMLMNFQAAEVLNSSEYVFGVQ